MRQHVGDGMRPAERADDPALFSGIFLLAGSVPDALPHRLRRGPKRGVPPVGIGLQYFIWIKKRRVLAMKEKLAVLGRAGPVHEPRRFEGGGIKACRLMAIAPDWAEDLPLRADGDEFPFYQK